MTKAIFKLDVSVGRMGDLTGVFVAEKQDVENLIKSGVEVYFGEVLGKHSEIYGAIEEKEIKMVTDAPATVAMFEEQNLASGHNPFNYSILNDDKNVLDAVREWATAQETSA